MATAEKSPKKVAVLGAGAIGSWFGALLSHHGREMEVVLVGRGAHGETMEETGQVTLHGRGPDLVAPVRATADPAAIAGSDMVLVTVKSQDTHSALEAASEYLGEALVVSIQNGVNTPVLSRLVPAERLVLGMTATNMTIFEPGVVTLQRDGVTVVGPSAAGTPATQVSLARDVLRRTSMRIAVRRNILGAQYNKLVFNAMGCASVVSRLDFLGDAILDDAWRTGVALPIHRECLHLFKAAGVKLARTPSFSDARFFGRILQTLGAPLLGPVLKRTVRAMATKPLVFSIQRDLERRKATEIDFINGEIHRLAEHCGSEAPFNEEVVRMVRRLEKAPEETWIDREEVVERFRHLGRSRM